ncbi:MAG: hypothetical protein ACI4PF_03910 [Christensenellales bacterium]
MNTNDMEVLRKTREEKRKEMDKISDYLYDKTGFNRGDNRIQVKENNVGVDTLFVAPGIDLTNLPDGWKYEANYNLDGPTKEVIYRMRDGKYEYIPIGHESNKSTVIKYSSPEDVVDAILAENAHIDKSQCYFDRNSSRIRIVGVVNDIKMPQGLEMRDGKIVDINDYGKFYEVEKALAQEISKDDMMSGTGDANTVGVQENISQNPYHDDPLSKYVKPNEKGATIEQYGMELFDFNRMKYVNHNYTKNERGEVVSKDKDGQYKSFGTKSELDPIVEATLELNEIWGNAYMAVAGVSGKGENRNPDMAFEGEASGVLFQKMMNKVLQSNSRDLSGILTYLCESDPEFLNNAGFIKVVGVFLSNPQVARVLGIENFANATPEAILAGVDKMANQHLLDDAKELDEEMQMLKTMNPNGTGGTH